MSDLTVIYLTVNKMPYRWVQYHMGHLLEAVQDRPLIVISRKSMSIDDPQGGTRPNTHYMLQDEPPSGWNIYVQLLRGAKVAETDFVAVAEDDTLYTWRHFSDFRPPMDAVAYDMSRWSVFSWLERPMFSVVRRPGNFAMIGPRELVIEALEERMARYPRGCAVHGEIGRQDVECRLGVTPRNAVEWYCIDPIVTLCHPLGLSPTCIGERGVKRKPGELKAWDIPRWGKAADIAAIYNRADEIELV